VRQQPQLGSRPEQIEDRIGDAPERIGLSPPGRMAAGDKGLEQRPFGIIEITGVGTNIDGGAPDHQTAHICSSGQHEIYSESTTCLEQ
jgi:hypothetical protein